MTRALHTGFYARIADIPPAAWDEIIPPGEPLHTHLFNRTVETAGVENAVFHFVVVRQNERILATATCAIFDIDLGLFLGKGAEKGLVRLRHVFPKFLKIKILVCGLPASFGQKNLAIVPGAPEAVLAVLSQAMDQLARERNIRYCCFKEFGEGEAERLGGLENLGYFRAHSIPDTRLDLRPFAGFDDYLAAMRSPYRRKIQLSLRKIGLSRPEIHPFSKEKASGEKPVLLFGGANVCPPEVFYPLYLSVMARAETKLETLNLAFFQNLYAQYADRLVVVALWQGGSVRGAVLLLPAGDILIWLLVGIEQAKDARFDTYFNLALGIVEYGFRRGFREIKTGQTAYPFKLRLGAEPVALFLFFKAKNRLKHFLLKKLRAVIFPETALPRLRIFKSQPGS